MSEQADALVRAVLKADTSPLSFDGALTYLRQREGSGRAVAKRIGVPESTIRGWGKGATPRAATRQRVIETVREARTRPSLLGDPGVLIPVVSQDRKRGSRERDVSGAQLGLRAGTLAEVRRIWVKTGNADAAAAAFVAGIGDPWYKAQIGRGIQRSQEETGVSKAGGGAGGGGGGAGGGAGGGGGGGDDDTEIVYDVDFELTDDYGMSIG